MTTRRTMLHASAASVALAAVNAAHASAMPAATAASAVTPDPVPAPVPAIAPGLHLVADAATLSDPYGMLDAVAHLTYDLVAPAWAAFKQAADAVIDLDPALLLSGDPHHPMVLLDEHAVGMLTEGIHDAMHLGFLLGRIGGTITVTAPQRICTTCHGQGLLWHGEWIRDRAGIDAEGDRCPSCGGSGVEEQIKTAPFPALV